MSEEEDEKRSEREDLEQQRREADLRAVMSTSSGRRFMWRLIDNVAGTFGLSFAGEALANAFNEGRRAVGVSLMTETQRLAKREYILMLSEQLNALPEEK